MNEVIHFFETHPTLGEWLKLAITATGIPGHSAYPKGKRNAAGMMLLLLRELGAEGPVAALAEEIGRASCRERV